MKPAVLIIGNGPYSYNLAKNFAVKGYSIIITTIDENSLTQIETFGYFPIFINNLHEESCKTIHEKCLKILNEEALELKYIIHSSRLSFYEFNGEEPPKAIKEEMYKVNSESPLLLAKYFFDTGCQFIFTSSCATKGFSKNLAKHTPLINGKNKIGTRGMKYYSYTKRLGEENLYNFFKEKNKLALLTIIYITLMNDTNFFVDMNVNTPKGGMTAEETAAIICSEIFKGNRRIYPDAPSKLAKTLPTGIVKLVLNTAEILSPLTNKNT